jgi:uncharacterized protein (UPF0332 family)
VSQQTDLDDIVRYWFEKADESLDAARDEMKAGRLSFSVNRIYYACFYSASAVLLMMRLRFRKHSGVRASFHQHLVKHGLVSLEHGKLYDELFEARQRGDYIELVTFECETSGRVAKPGWRFR